MQLVSVLSGKLLFSQRQFYSRILSLAVVCCSGIFTDFILRISIVSNIVSMRILVDVLTISPVSAWNYNKGSRSYRVLVSSSFSVGSDNTTQPSRWRRHASLHCTGQDKLLRGKLYTRFSCGAYARAASQKRERKQNLIEVNGGNQSSRPKRHNFLWYGELRFI